MSSREDLDFLFEAVSGLLHGEATGGAAELRADKFVARVERYCESRDELAKELAHLKKRVAELEEEKFNREMTGIEEQNPDDI